MGVRHRVQQTVYLPPDPGEGVGDDRLLLRLAKEDALGGEPTTSP
ncbi:hypothetical protein [Amycolatopsis sp. H20-H5]|nr:hypothetical protein [Amycolatopsis sp. H20-H5]MEC3977585.1 hypothetical protein [Amycolatopsis sp. H20-H5]